MANLKYIQRYGNQMTAVFDDGSKKLALPTHVDVWLVSGTGGGPPDPGSSVIAWPFSPSVISDHFGLRSDVGRWHEGTDFSGGAAHTGANLPSVANGTVDSINAYGSAFGNHVTVRHPAFTDGVYAGKQLVTLYAHMVNFPPVSNGQVVNKGDTLGALGNTGGSFGAHLHLEAHIVNPGAGLVFDYTNPNPAPPSNRTSVDFEYIMANYNSANEVIYP